MCVYIYISSFCFNEKLKRVRAEHVLIKQETTAENFVISQDRYASPRTLLRFRILYPCLLRSALLNLLYIPLSVLQSLVLLFQYPLSLSP